MNYDNILKELGEFGCYQKTRCFLLWMTVTFVALHNLAWVFVGALPSYRCMLPIENATSCTSDVFLNYSIPWSDNEWSKCKMYDLNFTWHNNVSESDIIISIPSSNKTISCDKWIFDRSQYKSSVVMDWNLVCEFGWIRAWAQTSYMLGVLCGSLILGSISDRYGRKNIFCSCIVLMMTFGVFTSIVPNFVTFCVFRFFTGAFAAAVYATAFILTVELVGKSKRSILGTITHFFFGFGMLLEALLAYFIRQWRYFQLSISLPMIFFLTYWWLIPESPRWLITKNRFKEAEAIVRKIEKFNNNNKNEKLLEELFHKEDYELIIKQNENQVQASSKEANLLDILKNRYLAKIAIITMCLWFIGDLVYYNLSLNTSLLHGNNYINFAISGVMEFPGYLMSIFLLKLLPRRYTQSGTLAFAGILLLFTLAVPKDLSLIVTILTMAGKMFISCSHAITYIYCAELYPTEVRQVGLSLAALAGKIGAALVPFIGTMSDFKPLPTIISGIVSLFVGALVLLLPETNDKELFNKIPETEGKEPPNKC